MEWGDRSPRGFDGARHDADGRYEQQHNEPAAGGVVFAVQHGDQYVWQYRGAPPYVVRELPLPAPPPDLVEAPSWALRAQYGIVPFAGRDDVLRDLRAWRDEGDALTVFLLHGPGGQGKTRVAEELLRRSDDEGWAVAVAASGGSMSARLSHAEGSRGLLLLVNYAEQWPAARLDALIDDHRREARVRILLLSRSAGPWWQQFTYRLRRRGLSAGGSWALGALAIDQEQRPNLFTDAARAFAGCLGADVIPEPPEDLADDRFASALTLHTAALVLVHAARAGAAAPESYSAYLLDREEDLWRELSSSRRDFSSAQDIAHITYVAALTRAMPAADAERAVEALRGRLSGSTRGCLDDHATIYAPTVDSFRLRALEPDRLAEDYVARSSATTRGRGRTLNVCSPSRATCRAFARP